MKEFLKVLGLGVLGVIVMAVCIAIFALLVYLLTEFVWLAVIFWTGVGILFLYSLGVYVKNEYFSEW